MKIVETSRLRDFSPDEARPTSLLDAGQARTLLLNLESGLSVAPYQMAVAVLYYVIEGHGYLRVNGEPPAELQTGSLAVAPIERQRLFFGTEHFGRAALRQPNRNSMQEA